MKPNTAVIAIPKSIKVAVKKDQVYFWCSCGLSSMQPFCDGAHKGTEFKPLKYIAEENKIVGFCGCKQTINAPFCDASHKQLT